LNLNNSFVKLSLLQKIEIYLIPVLIVFWILFTLFDSNKNQKTVQLPTTNTQVSKEEIDVKRCKIEILKSYEKIAKETQIVLTHIRFEANILKCEISGTSSQIFNFLFNIENFDEILSLQFVHQKDIIILHGAFKIENFSKRESYIVKNISIIPNIFFTQNSLDTINIPNEKIEIKRIDITQKKESKPPPIEPPLEEKKEKIVETITSQEKDLIEILPKSKTVAIIGEYALLDKKWLKVGDIYRGYTILKIDKNGISFEKDGQMAIKEMFDDN